MAITTSAGDGVRCTTSAVNETLGSQTQQTGSNTIVLSNTIANLSNGNLVASPTYVNRIIMIRRGTATEEYRLCTADTAGTGTTRILTVHENWTVVPAQNDDVRVSYIIQDCATVTGLALITKRNQDYTSTRKFRVGNSGGTNFCVMALLFGASLESVDNSSTTDPDIRVDTDGCFISGFTSSGTPVSGGELFHTPAVNGELTFECVSGGNVHWNDTVNIAVARPAFNFLASTTGKVRMKNIINKFNINDFRLGVQDTDINGIYLESDDTGTTPRVQVRNWSTGNEVKNITCVRFNGFETVTSGDDPTLRNILFDRMSKLLTVATGETWTIVNPIWNPTTANQNDISIAGTGEVLENFSLETTTKNLSETALTSKVYVVASSYRGGGASLRKELTSNASGITTSDVEKRRFTDNAGTSLTTATSSGHAIAVSEYGYLPTIRTYTPSNRDALSQNKLYGNSQSFSLSSDAFQVQTNAGTARTLGDTTHAVAINIGSVAQSFIIVKYTAGSGTLSVSDTITHSTSGGWSGTVKEIIEGNSTAGTIVVQRVGGTFQDTSGTLSNGAGWTSTYTTSTLRSFKNGIDAQTLTMQELYDYLNAKMDEATLDTATPTFFDQVLFWANGTSTPLPIVGTTLGSPNTFNTIRNSTTSEGWVVYNLGGAGLALVSSYISNNGTTFVPAITTTINITCTSVDTGNTIEGVRVYIDETTLIPPSLAQGETNGSGVYSVSLSLSLPFTINVRARRRGLTPFEVQTTIPSGTTTFNITAPMATDSAVERNR